MAKQTYEQAIRELSRLDADEIITNSSPEHATELFAVLFKRARYDVKVFSDQLSADVFGKNKVLDAFSAAVHRGVKFTFLLEKQPEAANPFYALIEREREENPGRVLMCIIDRTSGDGSPAEISTAIDAERHHLCVVDGSAFRWEQNHASCKAIASMNQPAVASKLNELFDMLYQAATEQSVAA